MNRDIFAFKLFCAHFCARHGVLRATGYGPLAATYVWRTLSASAKAPWLAVAETAAARSEEQAAEAAERARAATVEAALRLLKVRKFYYKGAHRQDLNDLIAEVTKIGVPDFEEA